jgi:hypothetical protein
MRQQTKKIPKKDKTNSQFVGKKFQVVLRSGFSYVGLIIKEDAVFITLIDKLSRSVSVNKADIETIKEVLEDDNKTNGG